MRKPLLSALLVLASLFIIFGFTYKARQNSDYYYWYNGEKIPLTLKKDKKYVLINQTPDVATLKASGKTKMLGAMA